MLRNKHTLTQASVAEGANLYILTGRCNSSEN